MNKIIPFIFSCLIGFSVIGQTINRGPYMQKATDNSIIFMWRTTTASSSKVWYGTDSTNLDQSVESASSVTYHELQVTGLSPATKYYYAVGTTTGQLTTPGQQYSFKTHPIPGTSVDTRIWCIGDFGRGNQGQIDVLQSYLGWTGDRVTDVWLWLGDNGYNDGTDSEYQQKLFELPGFSEYFNYQPFYPTPGNHDYGEVWAQSTLLGIPYTNIPLADHEGPYFDMVQVPQQGEAGGYPSQLEVFYSFDFGDVHFLSLNSEVFDYTLTGDGIAQMNAWIADDLAQNTRKFTIAYFHQPPYSKGSHDSDDSYELVMKAMREDVIPVLESYDVDLVVCGHSHVFERSMLIKDHTGSSGDFNASHIMDGSNGNFDQGNAYIKDGDNSTAEGTVYVVCGNSGSSESSPSLDYPAMIYSHGGSGAMGSFVIDVYKNKLDGKYLKVDGTIDDEFSIVKQDMSLNPLTDFQLCEGETLNVTASFSGGSDSISYAWSPSTETGQTASLSPTSSTTYTLEVTDEISGQVETTQFTVNVVSVVSQTITEPLPGTLGVDGCTGCTYQWFINGSPIGGANNQYFVPDFPGEYTCEVTNSSGCSVTTDVYNVVTVGLEDIENRDIQLFPNPASDMITLKTNEKMLGKTYQLLDVQGKVVLSGQIEQAQQVLNIQSLKSGQYLLKLLDEGQNIQLVFTKQ